MSVYNPDNPNYFDPSGNNGSGGDNSYFYTGSPGATDSWDPQVMGNNSNYGMNPSTGPTGTLDASGANNGGGIYNPGINQSGIGGWNQQLGQWLTGSNSPFTNAAFLPAMASAATEFSNANQYEQLGQQAENTANPMGDRSQYVQDLSNLEKDPSQIVNTPGYKFALDQTMDATGDKMASQGYLGSSQMQQALSQQASGLAQQTYNNTISQLSNLAGAQFNPAEAAQLQMEGGQLAMQARSNALGDMFYPFGPGAGNGGTTINNSTGGGGPGQGTYSAGSLPSAAISAIAAGGTAGVNAASNLMSQGIRYIKNPDGTTTDLYAYTQHGGDNGSGNTTPYYPTQSAVNASNDPNSQFYQGGDNTSAGGWDNIYQNVGGGTDASSTIDAAVPPDDLNPFLDGSGFDMTGGWS